MNYQQIVLSLHKINKVFYDIDTKSWVDCQDYLSGNVVSKAKRLKKVINGEQKIELPDWIRETLPKNLEALEKSKPIPALPDVSPELQLKCLKELEFDTKYLDEEDKKYLSQNTLEIDLGSTLIDCSIYEKFVEHLLKAKCNVVYINNEFHIKLHTYSYENNVTYGASKMDGKDILESILNLKSIKIYKTVSDSNRKNQTKQVLDVEATQEIQLKIAEIKKAWREWIWQDEERTIEITKVYNEVFNSYQRPKYDGSHLEFPNINPNVELTKEQKDDVYRLIKSRVVGLFAEVGFGKTWVMVTGAMELKRLKLAKRIIITVLSSTLEQFVKEIKFLYPNSKILYRLEKKSSKIPVKQQRAILYNQIRNEDWDIILLTHEQLTDIPLSPKTQEQLIQNAIYEAEEILNSVNNNAKIDYRKTRRLKNELNNFIAKKKEELQKLYYKNRQIVYTTWEDLNIDCLMVDESQQFKNLWFYTAQSNIAGLSNRNSLRANDLFNKVALLHQNKKRVVFATGTPVSNSISEVYTLMRYLIPDLLENCSISNFDRWVAQFGETAEKPEVTVTGTYKIKSRFTHFKNLPELMALIHRFASIRASNSNTFFEKPNPHYLTEEIKLTKLQQEYMESLAKRADAVIAGKIERTIDNMAKISAQARLNSIDVGLIGKTETEEWSKLNTLIRNAYLIYCLTNPVKGVQIIFCDLVNYVYDYLIEHLRQMGIPRTQIAPVQTAKNREELYKLAREGNVRIILASTTIAGTGVNIQTRLAVLHHLDAPWRPSDVIQREGRIVRQKNKFKDVIIFRYINQSPQNRMSYDTFIWQTLENKAKFYEQIWTNKSKLPRRIEDIYCEKSLSYSQVKAIASGNSLLIQQTELNNQIKNLEIELSIFKKQQFQIGMDRMTAKQNILEYSKMIQELSENEVKGHFAKQPISSYEELQKLMKTTKVSFIYEEIGQVNGMIIKTKFSEDQSNSNKIKMHYIMGNKTMPVHCLESLTKFCETMRAAKLEWAKEKLEYFKRIQNESVMPTFPKLDQLNELRDKLAKVEQQINQAVLEEANTNLSTSNEEEYDNEEVANDSEIEINFDSYEEKMDNTVTILNKCKEILNNLNNLTYLNENKLEWIKTLEKAVNEAIPTLAPTPKIITDNNEQPKLLKKEPSQSNPITPQISYQKESTGQLCLF